MTSKSALLRFVEETPLEPAIGLRFVKESPAADEPPLNLNQLPKGVLSGTSLIDYSNAPQDVRGGISLALAFASRAATAAVGRRGGGGDEDVWFAAYRENLERLGFGVSGTAFTVSRFKRFGLAAHEALVPFLTVAIGGAAAGPVLLALLKNLSDMDKDRPWITLFDRQSRRFETREVHFGAATANAIDTRIRQVAARLRVESDETNVLFFRVTSASAEFESATYEVVANNSLLAVLEEPLKERMKADALDFIREARISKTLD